MFESHEADSHTTYASSSVGSYRSTRNSITGIVSTLQGARHKKIGGRRSSATSSQDTEPIQSSFLLAIKAGERDLVEFFLSDGTDIEGRDERSGWTPTIWAVFWNRNDILSTLVRACADLTATDEKTGRTPLLWAASYGYTRAVEILLEGDKDKKALEIAGKDGMNPLALAYNNRQLEIARLCLEAGANADIDFRFPEASLLEWTVTNRDEEFANLLLEHGATADRNATDGISILIHAIHQGLPEAGRLLVQKGANPNCTDPNGDFALVLAIRYDYTSLAKELLAEGANRQVVDKYGVPVLTLAVKAQQEEVVKAILGNEYYPGIDNIDPEGNTPLLWAIRLNDAAIVKLLVRHYAAVTVSDFRGASAQYWAACTGNGEIINLVRPQQPGRGRSQLMSLPRAEWETVQDDGSKGGRCQGNG